MVDSIVPIMLLFFDVAVSAVAVQADGQPLVTKNMRENDVKERDSSNEILIPGLKEKYLSMRWTQVRELAIVQSCYCTIPTYFEYKK